MVMDKYRCWLIEVLITSNPYLSITFTTPRNTKPTKIEASKIYAQLAEEQALPCARLVLRVGKLNGGE